MLCHKTSLSKFKKIGIISGIFPNNYETRNQLQEKHCKKHKHLEAKQYTIKQAIGHWKNQRGNKKVPGDKWKQKNNDFQNLWDTEKAVLRGSL